MEEDKIVTKKNFGDFVCIRAPLGKTLRKSSRACPLHPEYDSKITDWVAPPGSDINCREFECGFDGHAFYDVVPKRQKKSKDQQVLDL